MSTASRAAELMAEYEDLKRRWADLRSRIQPVHDAMQAEFEESFAKAKAGAGGAVLDDQLRRLEAVQELARARDVLENQWWDKRRGESTV